jgi:Holliday junction resolvase RusA-like endonuclease
MARRPRKQSGPPLAPLLDVCIHGQRISAQTSRRRALAEWKQKVRSACEAAWPMHQALLDGPVRLRVTYDCEILAGDVDNLVKPIQDALQGVVYRDDRQISDVTGRRRMIDDLFRVRYMSPVLAMALSDGRPFVHVEVWPTPDQEVIG